MNLLARLRQGAQNIRTRLRGGAGGRAAAAPGRGSTSGSPPDG